MKAFFIILVLIGLGYTGWVYYDREQLRNTISPQMVETSGPSLAQPTDIPAPAGLNPDAAAAPEPYTTVDNVHVALAYTGMVGTKPFVGTVAVQSALVAGATGAIVGTVTADMTTLVSDNTALTALLQSDKGFDVKKYPRATFTITSFTPSARVSETFDVIGTLSVHGLQKTVSATATYGKLLHQYNLSVAFDPKTVNKTITNAGIITLALTIPLK